MQGAIYICNNVSLSYGQHHHFEKKREYKKYTLGGMSRLLVVLLAVFYISIIAMEAAHMHADVIETSASADAEDDPAANECKICAYFAH